MRRYLEALRTDPRFIACLGAILPLWLDDVPQPLYSTFHDPGAALILSLILGNALALAFVRGVRGLLTWYFFGGWGLKFLLQGFFYVRNAGVVDGFFLFATHGCIAAAAARDFRWRAVLRRVVWGEAAVLFSILLVSLGDWFGWGLNRTGFIVLFITFASLRVVLPYMFWTVLMADGRRNPVPSFIPPVAIARVPKLTREG